LTPTWAAVVDFDATLVEVDIGDTLSRRFRGVAEWTAADDDHAAGRCTFAQLIERQFGGMQVDRAHLEASARELGRVRAGFAAFATRLLDAGRPVVIASAGLDAYIRPVLDALPGGLGARLELVANAAGWHQGSTTVRFVGPPGCGRCGTCKGAVVEAVRARGHRVAYVGDGISDRCAARTADLVFARSRLIDICAEEGVACVPFTTFDDVAAAWPDLSAKT
jgi:2-hydroxy-3-keto-5-methylthiopentenyl-1-phosphate phosphatase